MNGLQRTLTLRDLVLAQILVVVGLNWLGPAARLGAMHWIYWLLGVLFFHLPLAIVVVHLSRRMPLEGGPYQWAKAAFGERIGFLVGWNIWLFVLLFSSTLGLNVTTAAGYATGAGEAWMSNRLVQAGMSAAVTGAIALLALAGFGASKWLHNAAGVALLAAAALLIVLPFFVQPAQAVAVERGSLSLMQIVLFTRIAVYALAGFECMSMVIAETREGAGGIARSIAIAVPCIAAIYIFGTQSVLTFVPSAAIDLVNPVSHTFATALGPFGRIAAIAAGAAILLVVTRDFAQGSQVFSVIARLPLVAGWDRLVPAWFTRLHPRTKTPVNAILFGAAIMLLCALGAIAAAGRQEAFQMLLSTAGVFFASTYFVIFAIPIVTRGTAWWVRVAAVSGLIVSTGFVILSFVPIVEVASSWRYAATIVVAVIGANALGGAMLRFRPQQQEGEKACPTERCITP